MQPHNVTRIRAPRLSTRHFDGKLTDTFDPSYFVILLLDVHDAYNPLDQRIIGNEFWNLLGRITLFPISISEKRNLIEVTPSPGRILEE